MITYKFLMNLCVKSIRYDKTLSGFKGMLLRGERFSTKLKYDDNPAGVGKDLFIIFNGPSLKTQDLGLLKGKDLMFVNRGFMHPLYKELQPKYHVFVDPKLLNGIWPLEWIEEIFRLSPSIKIIVPLKWWDKEKLEKYKNDDRFIWQEWEAPFYVNGVSNNCFSFAITQKYDNIFFTGFDGNGCAYDLIKSSESHFYGSDPELANMTSMQHAQALFTTFLQLYDLRDLSKFCAKRNINIYNLTNGGLLDMFIRRDFNSPYDKDKEIPINPSIFK